MELLRGSGPTDIDPDPIRLHAFAGFRRRIYYFVVESRLYCAATSNIFIFNCSLQNLKKQSGSE